MPVAFSPRALRVDLPPGHRFPMDKYDRVARRLEARGWAVRDAPAVEDEALALAHDRRYLDAVAGCALDARAERRLGFPQSPALVRRSRVSVGGTVAAARAALDAGLGTQLAGGTHHAFRDRGEGFCVYNDLVVAARALLAEGAVRRVLVIDLDVHQGNGTAALCAGDPRITTYSVHGDRNYPFVKERSDLDVPLPDGTCDGDYLAALDRSLPAFARAARPDLVLYQGGVDVLAGDRFGRLALSLEGVVERDRRVAAWCRDAAVPLVTTLGGGYHADVDATVDAHVAGLAIVAETLGV
ncbi:MAG: histone deacetylase [Trueperaceae bacterium]|nr:histone deacetylase [Trueperaceae bacterium]